MALMIVGILLFWMAHALKIHAPAKRIALARSMGDGPVKGLVAVALLGSVALMSVGYQQADFTSVWSPPDWTRHINNLLMIIAIACFTAGGIKSKLADKIRHPQLAGVKVWAFAHLLVNGDLASIILFGALLAWAVITMIALNKRDGKPPMVRQGTILRTLAHVVVTLLVFGAVAWVHMYLGVSPFPVSSA
ncbi:MAG: NnrU family protein [Pseudomonadota bacterium]